MKIVFIALKKGIICCLLLFTHILYGQTLAFPATYSYPNTSSCIDLSTLDPIVKGFQVDYLVSYFPTLTDAQNNSNPLNTFYSYSSDNETLYTRVTNNNDSSDFATSTLTLALFPLPCCPPPPLGINSYDFCDTDGDGFVTVNLYNLRDDYSLGFPTASFCNLNQSQINISYFTSEMDALNDTNPVDELYTFSATTEIYYKTTNSVNSDESIRQFGLNFISSCTIDTDNDGISDYDEDVNRNGIIFDDDTDQDGLMNYEDPDDDNDLILTIDEDYNSNGDPTDDDTNGNGFPDYLENSITLSSSNLDTIEITLIDNPVQDILKIRLDHNYNSVDLSIIDLSGKTIISKGINERNFSINVSILSSGMYFLIVSTEDRKEIRKFIKR